MHDINVVNCVSRLEVDLFAMLGHTVRTRPSRDPSRPPERSMNESKWTFLTNHSHVLILLHTNGNLVLREVAQRVGITERAVQRIVHSLEEAGYIERHKIGRQNTYRVRTDVALRHTIESHRTIGDLLAVFRQDSANERSSTDAS